MKASLLLIPVSAEDPAEERIRAPRDDVFQEIHLRIEIALKSVLALRVLQTDLGGCRKGFWTEL